MSKPRRAFGSTRPGQLLATRLKVAAAELADPHRLNRGRRYARDGSVVDITVDELATAAVVVGSRSEPYLVELSVERGEGPPSRDEMSAICTCPDADPGHASHPAASSDAGSSGEKAAFERRGAHPSETSVAWRPRGTGGAVACVWCKHAIAALLVLADEIAIEPELLDRWRGVSAGADDGRTEPDRPSPADARRGRPSSSSGAAGDAAHGGSGRDGQGSERPVGAGRLPAGDHPSDDGSDASPTDPDLLAAQLSVPAGATMPVVPDIEPLEHPLVIGDEQLHRWVTEMHALLRNR